MVDTVLSPTPTGGGSPAANNNATNVTPTSGQTVAIAASPIDQLLYITPAGTLAALTVTLPSNAASRIGQMVVICTTQTLTLLTINGASSIINNIATLTAGTAVTFFKVADNTWIQV